MNIAELKEKKISELAQMAKQLKVEGAAGMRKQELMFALLALTGLQLSAGAG